VLHSLNKVVFSYEKNCEGDGCLEKDFPRDLRMLITLYSLELAHVSM
jgi:hypothetical protein